MFGKTTAKPEEVTYLVILGRLTRLEIDKLLKETAPVTWRNDFSKRTMKDPVNKLVATNKHKDLINDITTNKLDIRFRKLLSTVFGRVIQNEEEYTLLLTGLTSDSALFGGDNQEKVIERYRAYPELIVLRLLELF
ncbi:hypothetical protein SM033_00156 [Vibrio phage vB_VpaM_sm033]|nr:hypothetical protein SM033_00156 [Vibrio phage vB_VpaM_sm033]